MLLLLLKSIPALIPFLAEIVNGPQKRTGDRRAKNKLAPWLILSLFINLVYMVYGFNWVATNNEHTRKLVLENDRLVQQVASADEIRGELSETRTKLRALKDVNDMLEDEADDVKKTLGEVTNLYSEAKKELSTQTQTVEALKAQYNTLFEQYEKEKEKGKYRAPTEKPKKALTRKSSETLRNLLGE